MNEEKQNEWFGKAMILNEKAYLKDGDDELDEDLIALHAIQVAHLLNKEITRNITHDNTNSRIT